MFRFEPFICIEGKILQVLIAIGITINVANFKVLFSMFNFMITLTFLN